MVDFTGLLEQLLSKIMTGLPKVLMALVVLIVGIIVSKLLAKAVRKLLVSINVDKLGDKLNDIDLVSRTNIEIKISSLLSKVFYYTFVLVTIIIAADVLQLPVLSELVLDVFNMIPHILIAGVILILGTLVADVVRKLVKTACESLAIPSAKLISMLIFYFILINVLVSAMTQAKIETDFLSQNITMLIAGAVLAFAIGYGLASKETVGNFLAANYVEKRVNIGDQITVGDHNGTVVDIDKSCVTLETGEKKVFIPLHQVGKSVIEVQ